MGLSLGQPLSYASTALCLTASTSTLLSRNARIVAVGDSNTEYGATAGPSYTTLSDLPVLASLNGDYNTDLFPQLWSAVPGWQGANCGVAGQSWSGITQRLTDALRYQPDSVYLAGGTNDGLDDTAGGNAKHPLYTADAQRAHDAGVRWVVLRACPPVAGAQFNTARHQGRLAFNAGLKAFADANPAWCRYVDIYTPNIKATGEALDGYLKADGLHFSGLGCAMNAPIVRAVFDAITQAGPSSLVTTFSAGNMLTNGLLTGSVAASGGVTGVVPTGWTAARTGSGTVVAALGANSDTGGQYVEFAVMPDATVAGALTFTPSVNSALVADSWYMCWAEVEVTGGGLYLGHPGTDQSGNTTFQSLSASSLYARSFLKTPPFKATGASRPVLTLPINAGGAAYTVRIRRVFDVAIADPFTTWNTGSPPVNTTPPTISLPGARSVGAVMTINAGAWSGLLATGLTDRRYRASVYRDGVSVATLLFGGPTTTYTLVSADQGVGITVGVSAANQAPSRSAEAMSAGLSGDITAPVLQSATMVLGQNTIVLTYNERLDPASVPLAGAYAITNSAGADEVTAVAVSGRVVTLTKTLTTSLSDTVSVAYTPGAAPVRDLATNSAASLSGQAVVISDVLIRLVNLGAQMTETANGAGWDYRSTSVGFSSTAYGASNRKIASGTDGYFGCSVATGLTYLSLKTNQTPTTYNGGLLGAGCTSLGGAYAGYGSNLTTVNAANSASSDNLRIRRVGTTVTFEVARAATPATWITVFQWTAVTTADLWANLYCGNTANRSAGLPYGSPGTV